MTILDAIRCFSLSLEMEADSAIHLAQSIERVASAGLQDDSGMLQDEAEHISYMYACTDPGSPEESALGEVLDILRR